jgi:hypothetical protein
VSGDIWSSPSSSSSSPFTSSSISSSSIWTVIGGKMQLL